MVLKVAVSPDSIQGDVDEGYGSVADAFRKNFAEGRDIGAAVAAYRDGVKVVDMWGGYRDGRTKQPWQHDTMVTLFSTTKGVSALTIAVAVSKGLFDYDDRVADIWPEFAQAGKHDVTVRQLLGHQAGLCALTPAPKLADVADPERLAPMLAAQKPAWPPGTRHGYHAITLGWYQSELIRRTDPAGRTLGRFLADEIAAPLGLDLYIGLPETVERERIAFVHNWKQWEPLLHANVMPLGFIALSMNPFGLSARTVRVPSDIATFDGAYNRPDVQAVEMPSTNGQATARAVAQLYGAAAVGGGDIGLTRAAFDELQATPSPPSRGLKDAVSHVDVIYSLGFCKPVLPHFSFGSSDKAFGTPGFGGSFGFADPDTGTGFAYVMNRHGFHLYSDPRELALRRALFRDVLKTRPQT
jgi:CubicO group peptidase (beta-lactamase class C family)